MSDFEEELTYKQLQNQLADKDVVIHALEQTIDYLLKGESNAGQSKTIT